MASDSVVTFNELHYNAVDGQTEWVELHNQMSIRVDVSHWQLDGGIDLTFPEGTVIEPKGFLVIGGVGHNGPLTFRGNLANDGERIRLRDRNGRLMDEITYGDSGEWPLGPDGSGCTLAKRWPSLASGEAKSWTTSAQYGGTPGKANFETKQTETFLAGLAISEVSGEGAFWLELENRAGLGIELLGHELRWSEGGKSFPLPASFLAAGARRVFKAEEIGFQPANGDKVFLLEKSGAFLDGVRRKKQPQARLPKDLAWHAVAKPTPGEPNIVPLQDAVVINEIMYHAPPKLDSPETAEFDYAENPEEWVEFHHRGETEIDLTGWGVRGGIRYDFPNGAKLKPKEFLVVAKDVAALSKKYPEARVLGPFEGSLSDRSDTIRLEDALGNAADEVRYYDSGRWSRWADGGGCSLELRDPNADNGVPEAWAASDESAKSQWVTINYEGPPAEPPRTNYPKVFNEFLMGLLDAGEALVDDVSVLLDPAGAPEELMQNGGFADFDPAKNTVNKWRILGTHAGSVSDVDPDKPDNRVLRLSATGGLEHSYNIASTTFAGNKRFDASKTYRISLRARWLRGSPQLNTRLYFNKLARTTILPIPEKLGTPGRPNSRLENNIGPTFGRFEVAPVSPGPIDPVTVRALVSDPQGVRSVELWYRQNTGGWQLAEMTTAKDAGGWYQGVIPALPANTLVQLYATATDHTSFSANFPPRGPDSRALYRVGQVSGKTVDTLKVLMTSADHAFLRRAEHAVSNGRLPGTVITHDGEAHFDVGIRLRSSPYGRPSDRAGFNIEFDPMQPFRGVQDTIAIDRSVVMPNGNGNGYLKVGIGAGTNEFIINQIAQKAGGIAVPYDDVIYLDPPTRTEGALAMLRLERYGPGYLNDQYEDNGEGALFKYELVYHPTRSVDGKPESIKGAYNAVLGIDIRFLDANKESYRYNFLISNNRDRDDYRGIINLAKALSSPAAELDANCRQAMDVDQWFRYFALISLTGVADTYNNGLEHNMQIYVGPDGKALAFPWDLDHGFYYAPEMSPSGTGNSNLGKLIAQPKNRRAYYGHLLDIIHKSYNLDYLGPWIDHLNEATGQKWQDRFKSYITKRRNSVSAAIRRAVPDATFQITTNEGKDFSTTTPLVTLTGDGSVELKDIRHEATGEIYQPEWTDIDSWQIQVPLRLGDNLIKLQALDYGGQPLTSTSGPLADTITVTYAAEGDPATAGNLAISEIFYHPANDQALATATPDDLEFIELRNTSDLTIDLRGVRLTGGVNFAFPADKPVLLGAGKRGLLVRNQAVFEAAHPGQLILGQYGDKAVAGGGQKLSNGGEKLELVDRLGREILDFNYGDGGDWPSQADGQGYSLVFKGGDPDDPSNWRASAQKGGSPGLADGVTLSTWLAGRDPKADPDGNGLTFAQEYLFGVEGSAPAPRPAVTIQGDKVALRISLRAGTDDVSAVLEASDDLKTWRVAENTKPLPSSPDGPNRVSVGWETSRNGAARYLRVATRVR